MLVASDCCATLAASQVEARSGDPVTLCLCPQTALHLAVHLDQPGTVRALVLKGASRVLQDRHGDTALHVACQRQHLACARCLLEGQPEPGREPSHSLDLQLQNWQGTSSPKTCEMRRVPLSGKGGS
jgi:hypothetical protein